MSETRKAMYLFRDTQRPCRRVSLYWPWWSNQTLKSPRRIEGVESEVQYLRKQLDEMRELLQQSHAHTTPKSQITHSPTELRDRQQQGRRESFCDSLGSQYPHSQDHSQSELPTIPAPGSGGYMNGHQYQRSMPSIPTLSPNEIGTQSIYGASNQMITRPLKRKRSGFEVRDEPIADFIDKGLITIEYAVSYFTTYVTLHDPSRKRLWLSFWLSFRFFGGCVCAILHIDTLPRLIFERYTGQIHPNLRSGIRHIRLRPIPKQHSPQCHMYNWLHGWNQ
jgi:hypothetical protein